MDLKTFHSVLYTIQNEFKQIIINSKYHTESERESARESTKPNITKAFFCAPQKNNSFQPAMQQ